MPVRINLCESTLRDLIERQGLQQWKAAEILGVSRDTVNRNCKRLGLKTHRTGPRTGPAHTGWKGGRRLIKGYLYLYRPEHPNATKQGYVAEHRLVMEQKLGRALDPSEVVHHLNGVTDDNRPENLGIYSSNAAHLRETLRGKCPQWTQEGKERIQRGLIKRASQLRSGIGAPRRNQKTGRFEARPDKSSQEAS